MSRVITFSRTFPAYHPKVGQPTYFVEKILRGIYLLDDHVKGIMDMDVWSKCQPKHHTIRAGNRWKVGDKFSPRVWSGKPYNTKMITIAPDIEIKKVWEFKINRGGFYINGRQYDGEIESHHELLELLALNDGLESRDLLEWFQYPKDFSGQIICWNETINY